MFCFELVEWAHPSYQQSSAMDFDSISSQFLVAFAINNLFVISLISLLHTFAMYHVLYMHEFLQKNCLDYIFYFLSGKFEAVSIVIGILSFPTTNLFAFAFIQLLHTLAMHLMYCTCMNSCRKTVWTISFTS